ncbi:MAG: ABC transporter ATP-binding protein [Chloroflexi bacterium]|nr:ABC transporter ATP-binding protein [Chloroflexota bacterium]
MRSEIEPLLRVRDLSVTFPAAPDRTYAVVERVSFDVGRGEIVGLVGESGSGKSMSLLSILGAVPRPGLVSATSLSFEGRDLLALSEPARRELRGSRIALIPADALGALDPVLRVGEQTADVIVDHDAQPRRSIATARVLEAFREVSLPNPKSRFRSYPHQLSGGMQQRVVIAAGLLLTPDLLLADEPTTALDATIQAQVLRLLASIRETRGVSIILVSHDLATVAMISDRILVMYAARIVESGPTLAVMSAPAHPYTRALLAAAPTLDREITTTLPTIPGAPPDLRVSDQGCRFRARCPVFEFLGAPSECVSSDPPLRPVADGRLAACHHVDEGFPVVGAGTLASGSLP